MKHIKYKILIKNMNLNSCFIPGNTLEDTGSAWFLVHRLRDYNVP